ncbi:MAG: TlpA family protein disulfide reductase [Chitinophagaceae bacterium]|nr:TlpA family protein disulfide reductase [Chitinophagaceae bacterium]
MLQNLLFLSLFSSFSPTNDTIKIKAIDVNTYDYQVSSVTPLQNTNFTNEALVAEFNGRILFKEFYLSNLLYNKGCSNAVFHLFIGYKKDRIYIGMDENHNNEFESSEITSMPGSKKKIWTKEIQPRKYCDTSMLSEKSVIHLIPFKNNVRYNDASSSDTMLQLSISKGSIKKFKLNDSTFIYSHPATFAKKDNSYVSNFTLKQPNSIKRVQAVKDLVEIGNQFYEIIMTTNKDELVLHKVKSNNAITIQKISNETLNSLKIISLETLQQQPIEIEKEYTLIDFWATWCKPCIASMPKVDQLYQREKNRLQIVSICVDPEDKITLAQKIATEQQSSYRHYFFKADPYNLGALTTDFGITAFPTYILIDKTGKVIQYTNNIDEIRL